MAKPKFTDPALDHQPLRWADLDEHQQATGDALMQEHYTGLSDKMLKQAGSLREQATRSKPTSAKAQTARASRLEEAAPGMTNKPISLDEAAANRVKYVEHAATDVRMPGENIAGGGWYFGAHAELAKSGAVDERHKAVSSALSPGVQPEHERASASALVGAHQSGEVTINKTLAGHLKRRGVEVPESVIGVSQQFKHLPANVVGALTDPAVRKSVARQSRNVAWDEIGKVSNPNNIAKAHNILASEDFEAQSPTGSPKTWSYANNIDKAVPGTPEHHEYMMRAADLGSKIRGENNIGQQMFDYHGLRDSNEGILSNRGHTAEDSWQHAITVDAENPQHRKAVGDVQMTRKTYQGQTVHPDARVSGASIQHAWNNEATSRASQHLEAKYQTEYTVPSTLTQEAGWTAVRRLSGPRKGGTADMDYNKHLNAQKAEAKTAAKYEGAADPAFSRARDEIRKASGQKAPRSQQFTQQGLF